MDAQGDRRFRSLNNPESPQPDAAKFGKISSENYGSDSLLSIKSRS